MGVLLLGVVFERSCCGLGYLLSVGEVIRYGAWIVKKEHVEVLFQVRISLCLTKLLHVLLRVFSVDVAKERVGQERPIVVEVYVVWVVRVIHTGWRLAVVVRLDKSLVLWRARWPIEVEVEVSMLVGCRVEGGMLVQGGCRAEIEGQMFPRLVSVRSEWHLGRAALHVLCVVEWWKASYGWNKGWLYWKFGRYTRITCCVWGHVLSSELTLYHLVLFFHEHPFLVLVVIKLLIEHTNERIFICEYVAPNLIFCVAELLNNSLNNFLIELFLWSSVKILSLK